MYNIIIISNVVKVNRRLKKKYQYISAIAYLDSRKMFSFKLNRPFRIKYNLGSYVLHKENIKLHLFISITSHDDRSTDDYYIIVLYKCTVVLSNKRLENN